MHEHYPDSGFHMFLMGMDGPFGNLFVDTIKTMPYPIIYHPPNSRFRQPDNFNCGVCWVLFIYDTILAFHHRPFMETSCGEHDVEANFGKYVHSKVWLSGRGTERNEIMRVVNPILTLFRKEMVLMIERMRWCFLLANNCDVTRHSSWGDIHQNHAAILDSTDHGKYVQPILDERNNDLNTPVHQLYLREKYLRKRINDGTKVPALETNTEVFLTPLLLAEMYLEKIKPGGDLATIIANNPKPRRHRKKLFNIRFYCELILRGGWYNMYLPKPDENPTFAKEKERLGSIGIPTDLIDVTGDGNCLFYCMLNFLHETDGLGHSWPDYDNPVMHMRHLLSNWGNTMKQSYWTYLSGYTSKEARLRCLYDVAINYMDKEFMLKNENADYLGEVFDAAISAQVF
jgi:hypothetical protein